MKIVKTAAAMQKLALTWRREGRKVGFVPTMGYLHAGHISLVKDARKRVGPKGIVVVSIYVNPTQFAPTEDLSRYPRDFAGDRRQCAEAGADVIFFPTDAEMYPGKDEGRFSTYVVEDRLSLGMEGGTRPTHFKGVTTIVAKLFNLVLPDIAIFGAKDWQQAAVIRRMAVDLNFPLKVIVRPTVREKDGLAMSSRNKYLSPEDRELATVLLRAISAAKAAVILKAASAKALKSSTEALISGQSSGRLDYVEFFHPETLQPVELVAPGSQMALAVYFGRTRLIDNAAL